MAALLNRSYRLMLEGVREGLMAESAEVLGFDLVFMLTPAVKGTSQTQQC
jgi:hypothetical protein